MPIKYDFITPDRVIFGRGTVEELGNIVHALKGKKVFIVTDQGVAGLDAFKLVEKSLREHNIDYHLYAEVDANPTDVQVDEGARRYKEQNSDIIVAVGGEELP